MKSGKKSDKSTLDIPDHLQDNQLFNELFEIERGLWGVLGKDNAIEYIHKHFAPKGIILFKAYGETVIYSKKDYVKTAMQPSSWLSYKFTNFAFQELSPDTYALIYDIRTITDDYTVYKRGVNTLYQKNADGNWQVILHQQSY